MEHHNEVFTIGMIPRAVDNGTTLPLKDHMLKITYHNKTTPEQKQEWRWDLTGDSKEALRPQPTGHAAEQWKMQQTPAGTIVSWYGSKTSKLQLRINTDGYTFLEQLKGCYQLDIQTPWEVWLGSSYCDTLPKSLSSYGVFIKARHISQEFSLNVHDLVLEAQQRLIQNERAILGIFSTARLVGPDLRLKGHLMADDAQVDIQGDSVKLHGPIDNANVLKNASLKIKAGILDQKLDPKLSQAHCPFLYVGDNIPAQQESNVFCNLNNLTLELTHGCHWNQPLSIPGLLAITLSENAREPLIIESPLRANKGIILKSHSQSIILDNEKKGDASTSQSCGSCESAEGPITITTPILKVHDGQIVSKEKLFMKVLQLISHGRIHSATTIESICDAIELHKSMTAEDTILLESGTFLYEACPIIAKNLVHLKLKQGGVLTKPLVVPGLLKLEILGDSKNLLTILTDVTGEKGLEILCLGKKLYLGKIDGPKGTLNSSQGKVKIETSNLSFLHGSINGYKGIDATASWEIIQGLEHGKEKATTRNVTYSGMSNGRSFSSSSNVPWVEFSPCHWRSDGGPLVINAPLIELNGGSIWTKGLYYTASVSSMGYSGVIHNGVTLDILGNGLIDARFFYHGPCLNPYPDHYKTLKHECLGMFKKVSASHTAQPTHLVPAGEFSRLSVDGELEFRVKRGRNVASTISAKVLKGDTPIQAEALLTNLVVQGHPQYNGKAPLPIQSASQVIEFGIPAPVSNAGSIMSPVIHIPFTALHNGPSASALIPVKLPERRVRVSLIDYFSGQGGAEATPTGPYAIAPQNPPPSMEELAPRVLITPKGFVPFPLTMRALNDPQTESRLITQALMENTGSNVLPGFEDLTPLETLKKLRADTHQWFLHSTGIQEEKEGQKALIPISLQGTEHLARALAQADQPLLPYTPTSFNNEEVASAELFFPPTWNSKAPRPGPGVIAGDFVALEGTPNALITNTGHIHAEKKGIITGDTLNQVKILDYGTRPALAIEDHRGKQIVGPTPYQFRWGGEMTGGAWEWHLNHVINTLGIVHVEDLWADLYSHYNSGRVVVENKCIWDVKHTQQQRLQRSWEVTTFHQRTKKSWWGLSEDTTFWTQTHYLSDSYPTELSGYFHAGTLLSGPEAGLNDIFSDREVPLEPTMQDYFLQGGTIDTAEGGMSLWVHDHLQTTPNIDSSLQAYSISKGGSFRNCSESGSIRRQSILVPAMVSEGSLQWRSDNTMALQALHAKVKGQGKVLSFKARRAILFPDTKVWQEETPHFEKKGSATYKVSSFHEIGAVPTFDNPQGHIAIVSEEYIKGVQPRLDSLTQEIDAPAIELYQQILRKECQLELIDSGQIDPGILALVSLAATIATAGTAAPYLVGALGLAKGGVAAAMMSAGVCSLSSQVAVAMVANQGNVGQALKNVASSDGLRSFALAVGSAGLCHQAGAMLKIDMNPSFKAALNPKQPLSIVDFLKPSVLRSTIDASLNITIGGKSFEKAITDALKQAPVNAAAAYVAHKIGAVYKSHKMDAQNINASAAYEMDPFTHKIAHGLLGGAMGAILSDNVSSGLISGAVGAMAAEIAAEVLIPDVQEIGLNILDEAAQKGEQLSKEDYNTACEAAIKQKMDFAKIIAGSVALAAQKDVNIAISTATNAVENNFMPLVFFCLTTAGSAWTAYEVYDTFKKEGVDAAVKQLVAYGLIAAAGGAVIKGAAGAGYYVAGKFCPNALEAWAAYVAASPLLSTVIQKASTYIGKAKDVAANSSVVKKLNQVSDSLEALRDKAARRMGLDKFARNEQGAGKGLGKQPDSLEISDKKVSTLDLLKDAEYAKKPRTEGIRNLNVDNDTLQTIGKAEARGGKGFSGLEKEIVREKEATWSVMQESKWVKQNTGGKERIINYNDPNTGLTKFRVHSVTDTEGKIVHQDFDVVRIESGQQIGKNQKIGNE